MVQNIDKRKCYRFEVSGGKVKYKKVKVFDFHKGFSIDCRLINLSKGGANFTCEEIIRKGKKLIVKLLIPDYEPLELLGK
ncbi:MAG: PilZ domain-containing protein [Candidatus Marinimicrobia bacterium]|nr:PilZ domain-containing protein [Candidatus Neomarinimicrobiota bacterium]